MPESSGMWHQVYSVLVVDDDENWCYLSKKIIERAGFSGDIITLKNGQEAFTYLENNSRASNRQPSLIFLDIKMPVMNGFEFLEAVLKTENLNLNQTRIYICSSSFNPRDKSQAALYPIAGYITKPLTKEILNEILS